MIARKMIAGMHLAFGLALSLHVMAQMAGEPIPTKTLKKLDAAWQQTVADFELPSMAVAVVKDGEVIWAKGYGTGGGGRQDRCGNLPRASGRPPRRRGPRTEPDG